MSKDCSGRKQRQVRDMQADVQSAELQVLSAFTCLTLLMGMEGDVAAQGPLMFQAMPATYDLFGSVSTSP